MYLTIDELKARFGEDEVVQRLDHDGDGTADAAVFERIRQDTEAEIDFYLSQRYATPLQGAGSRQEARRGVAPTGNEHIPEIVKAIAADIARKRLFEPNPPDHVVSAYKQALRRLEQIAQGRLNLPGIALSADPQSSDATVRFAAGTPSSLADAYRSA